MQKPGQILLNRQGLSENITTSGSKRSKQKAAACAGCQNGSLFLAVAEHVEVLPVEFVLGGV
ncbi:MAG: hypothetical protein K2F63_03070, partial [Muribaculaceae bacterium]|nr:hypothetical protein [Muribaculaceae bacterium]